MNQKRFITSEIIPKSPWEALSMTEKSEMMKVAVRNGITDLKEIRQKYNEFAEGGDTENDEPELKPWKALDNIDYTAVPDPSFTREKTGAGSIEVMFNDTPNEGYEYGTGYKYPHPMPGHNVVIYNPKDNDAQDIRLDALHIMPQDATYDALRSELAYYADDSDIAENAKWRMKEDVKKYGHLLPGMTYQDYYNNEVDGFLRNMLIEGSPEYIESKRYYPNKQQLREWNKELMPFVDKIQNYLESGERPANILPEVFVYGNKHSDGGKIHIKPENRGKFTALKERTGHSATWFKEHGTPAQKKMATFALNARKWNHDLGGPLVEAANRFDDGGYTYDADTGRAFGELPEVIVAAPRKYVARYDENGNPVYTTDPSLSMASRPFGDERARRERIAEIKNRPKGQLGDYAGFGQNLALMGAGAAAAPWLFAPMVAGAIEAPVSTAAGFVGGEVGAWGDRKLGVSKAVNDNHLLAFDLPEGTVGGLFGGLAGGVGTAMTGVDRKAIEGGKNLYRAWNVSRAVDKSPLAVPEGLGLSVPKVRTRVGDVEIDNPNLLYHLDRGDGAGAFSNQGAYVADGTLFPGIPEESSAVPYSWWNKGKPYATSVKGEPMTRLMTATEDASNMLHVRSQDYPIGQWNGKRGFVLNSEYVNPKGVDVSGSTYTLDPKYGWRRVSPTPEPPAAQWAKAVQEMNTNNKIAQYANSRKNAVKQMNERMADSEYAAMIRENTNPEYRVEGEPIYIEGKDRKGAKETANFLYDVIEQAIPSSEQSAYYLETLNGLHNDKAMALSHTPYAYIPKKNILLSRDYINTASSSAGKQHQYSILKAHEGSHIYAHPKEQSPLAPHLTGWDVKYFAEQNGAELSARGTQLKNYFDKGTITEDELKYAAKHYIEDTGIDNNMSSMFEQIKQAAKKNPNIWKQMASWFSKVSPVVGALYSFDNKNKEQ